MKNIYDYTLLDLENIFLEQGYKKFNASQVFDWIYKKRIKDFDEMTNIKKELREYIKENFIMGSIEIIEKQEDIDVSKFLFRLNDDQ